MVKKEKCFSLPNGKVVCSKSKGAKKNYDDEKVKCSKRKGTWRKVPCKGGAKKTEKKPARKPASKAKPAVSKKPKPTTKPASKAKPSKTKIKKLLKDYNEILKAFDEYYDEELVSLIKSETIKKKIINTDLISDKMEIAKKKLKEKWDFTDSYGYKISDARKIEQQIKKERGFAPELDYEKGGMFDDMVYK